MPRQKENTEQSDNYIKTEQEEINIKEMEQNKMPQQETATEHNKNENKQ